MDLMQLEWFNSTTAVTTYYIGITKIILVWIDITMTPKLSTISKDKYAFPKYSISIRDNPKRKLGSAVLSHFITEIFLLN